MSTTVRGAAPISLPIETCWENLRDLTRARHYVPGLTDTVITTEKNEGIGASRIVTHRQFGAMDETVVAWDEGVGMTVRLHKGDKSLISENKILEIPVRVINKDNVVAFQEELAALLQ